VIAEENWNRAFAADVINQMKNVRARKFVQAAEILSMNALAEEQGKFELLTSWMEPCK
jgi:hypothetical protein